MCLFFLSYILKLSLQILYIFFIVSFTNLILFCFHLLVLFFSSALSPSSPTDLPVFNFYRTFFTSSSLISNLFTFTFYMGLILFLGYLRLFLLCLVLRFSPFLFHMFLFLLGSNYSIHLSYSDVSGIFVSKTFLFSLSLLFPLVLSHLHHIFSALFPLPPFH